MKCSAPAIESIYANHIDGPMFTVERKKEKKLKITSHSNNYFTFLAVLNFCCYEGFSLGAASRGYFLVSMHELLIVVASFIEEHRP